MPEHLFFYIALAFILTHEMDAIRCKEWQIFPGLSALSDSWGYIVFTLLHIPLYGLMFWALWGNGLNEKLIVGLDIFFIIHIGLHLLALRHPKNQFTSWVSWLIIIGAGFFASLDLLIS
jgi:hypothetical protein